MPIITDADMERVKSLVKAGQIEKAHTLLKSFNDPRAIKALANFNNRYQPSSRENGPSDCARLAFVIGAVLLALVIMGALGLAAFLSRSGQSRGPSQEMLAGLRDMCIAVAPFGYETEGVNPQIISDGCMDTALALYNYAPEPYSKCYEAMGDKVNAIAFGGCINTYGLPTVTAWPLDKVLQKRVYNTPESIPTTENIIFPTISFGS